MPGNALAATAGLWRTVDLMWSLAGDRATDASYYTKRSLLAAVWSSTFLFWLDDRSDGLEASWAFLERRIDNVMQIGRLRARIEDAWGPRSGSIPWPRAADAAGPQYGRMMSSTWAP